MNLSPASFPLLASLDPWMTATVLLYMKGLFLLAGAGLLTYALQKSAAATRHLVWSAALLLLLLLPLAVLVVPNLELAVLPQPGAVISEPASSRFALEMEADGAIQRWETPAEASSPALPASSASAGNLWGSFAERVSSHWFNLIILTWSLGVLVLLVRLALAHAGVKYLISRAELVHEDDWQLLSESLSEKLEIKNYVRLRWSALTNIPLSMGILKPTILLPIEAAQWDEERRETVLAHELAHVKRRDCLTQFVSNIAVAINWMNPLTWVALNQQIIERERACDDLVIMMGTKPSSYAETLLASARMLCASSWSSRAVMSIARKSQLEGRLLAILDPAQPRGINKSSRWLTFALVAAIALPLSAVSLVPQSEKSETSVSADTNWKPQKLTVPAVPESPPLVNVQPKPAPMPRPTPNPKPNVRIKASASVVALDTLTIEQLIELKKYGVSADFMRAIKEMGYDEVDFHELLDLAKYGADEDFIREINEAGYTNLSLYELADMAKYGVDGDLVKGMASYGYDNLNADEITSASKYGVDESFLYELKDLGLTGIDIWDVIELRKYGVDAAYTAAMRDAGFDDLDIDALIEMRKHGVKPGMVEAMASAGYDNLDYDDLIDMSKFGVSPSFINAMSEAGYDDLDTDDLINMSKFGVNAGYIRGMMESGYDNLDVDDLVSLRKFGVDPDYVSAMSRAGFEDLYADDIIALRKYGVDPAFVKEMANSGYENLEIDDLIDMSKYGVNADYIRELREAGLGQLDIQDIIDMRKHGVDAEYIREMRDN